MSNSGQKFCHYCHLPLLYPTPGPSFCSYGCDLASTQQDRPLHYKTLIVGYVFAVLALVFSLFSLELPGIDGTYWPSLIFTTASTVLLGPPLFRHALLPLLHGRMPVEILHLFALTTSYGISALAPLIAQGGDDMIGSQVSFFHVTALFFIIVPILSFWEAKLRYLSLSELRDILNLRVNEARLIKGSTENFIKTTELKKNDCFRVLPGERIPHDGLVKRGTTRVIETAVTGTQSPVYKNRDDWVLAGTHNEDSPIDVVVKTEFSENFIERIIRQWNIIRSEPSDIQKRIDLAIYIIIPVVFLLAGFVYSFALQRGDPNLGLTSALAIVLIPVLSSLWRNFSIGVNLGMGQSLKAGVMLKNAISLFKLARLNCLFFDKTGTITQGEFTFSQLFLEPGVNQGEVLTAFFSLGDQTNHPISSGLKTHPWYMEIEKVPVRNFKYMTGLGISGSLSGRSTPEKMVVVGSVRYLRRYQMQISSAMRDKIDLLESMGEIVILCGWNGSAKALMSLSDTLRKDIKPLLADLNELRIKSVVVTGDHDEMIAHLSQTKGIHQIFTRCLPEEKIKKIKKFKEEGYHVGYVGTVHDDPSLLSSSDAGIIFHSGPADVIQKTEVSIFGNNLQSIVKLIKIARKCRRIILFNTYLGLLFTCGGLALCVLNMVTPYFALLSMAATSVVLNLTPLALKKKFEEPSI